MIETHDVPKGLRHTQRGTAPAHTLASTPLTAVIPPFPQVTTRLSDTPAIVTGHETESMRRMLMVAGVEKGEKEKMDLEINPRHPLISQVASMRESQPTLAEDVVYQVFDNAKCAAGILDDPRNMLPRLNRLLQAVTPAEPSAVSSAPSPAQEGGSDQPPDSGPSRGEEAASSSASA